MTGWGQLSVRVQTAFDRLAWGFGDLKRILIENGAWPSGTHRLVSSDGKHWSVTGARLKGAASDQPKAQGLLVLESNCLWGTVQLPEMQRGALQSAVEEALWRVSPLPPDQVAAAWHAVPNGQGGWSVDWGICRRSDRDEGLAKHGLAADAAVFLGRQDHALAVRGNAWVMQSRRQRWLDAAAVGMALALLGALALPVLMPLLLKQQAVSLALQHVVQLEPKAAPLRQQLDELRHQAMLAEELRRNVGADLPLASVIDALSEALPGDTWLDRMDITGNEIRISGLTSNATELLAQLGRQPVWADTRATAANVRDNGLNKERFSFELRWSGQGVKP